jgi:hypothetical protein
MTIGAAGTGSAPGASFAATSCTNPIFGSVTAVQTGTWTVSIVLVAGLLAGLQLTIPTTGLTLTGGSCLFTLNGTITWGRAYSGPLPIVVSTAHAFSVLSSRLTIDQNNGGCASYAPVGLTGTWSSSYTLSRSMTLSG